MAEGFRLRVCYRKTGRLRFLSHLEVARACERLARRARLPYAVSQGFTPHMRLSFGPALPVGTAGEGEYFELVLTRFVPVEHAYAAMVAATVEDLAPIACAYVPAAEKALAAAANIAAYDVRVEGGIPQEEIERSLDALMQAGTVHVEHKGKQKVFDLAEALPKEPEVTSTQGCTTVRVWVRMGEQGSMRPESFIAAALGADVPVVVTRTDLLIEDEGAWRRPL